MQVAQLKISMVWMKMLINQMLSEYFIIQALHDVMHEVEISGE